MELGIVIFARLEQFENASLPMLVTELGIVIFVNPEDLNALFPILVTELGMVTSVNLEHPKKVLSPMLVTEFESEISVNLEQS